MAAQLKRTHISLLNICFSSTALILITINVKSVICVRKLVIAFISFLAKPIALNDVLIFGLV